MNESAGDQFPVLLNARASNPGHSYLRLLRRKCLLPSAPRVRLRTLNRTSYESKNAMTNEPTAARAASTLRNFSNLGTSDRVVGRPRTGCVARVFYRERTHLQLVNAIFANICSMVTHTILRAAEPGRIARSGRGPYLRFQIIPDRWGDSGYNSYRKRRTPRK